MTTPTTDPATPPATPGPPAPSTGYTAPATQEDLDRLIGQRLNQERAKFGGVTAEQFAEMREKAKRADELEAANATDVEKREKAARDAARAEADSEYRPRLAETAFRVAIGDRLTGDEVNEFLAETNMAPFIKDDGNVDTAKVLARVARLAPAKSTTGTTPPPKGPVVPAHNPGGPPTSKPGDAGRAAVQRMFGKTPA